MLGFIRKFRPKPFHQIDPSKGDVIIVTGQSDPSWWLGKKDADGPEG
jgi:hypothetical protein